MSAWTLLTLAAVLRLAARLVEAERGDERQVATPRQVDLNRASVAELATLPGIGPQRARAIVLHRVRHGPFAQRTDLARVDGIGPTTLRDLSGYLAPLPSDPPP